MVGHWGNPSSLIAMPLLLGEHSMLLVTLIICGMAAYLAGKFLADEPIWLRIVIYLALVAVAFIVGIRSHEIGG